MTALTQKWRFAAIGAALAMPLALSAVADLGDVAGLLAVVATSALLAGGVICGTTAGLSARRRGFLGVYPVIATMAVYFVGASGVLAMAWLIALRWSTLRGFIVSPSVGIGALVTLWIVAAISAAVVIVALAATNVASQRRPNSD